ncbi:unnamed protein product [Clonostachys byssicola]|uniref:NADH-cytochrome b5 reductase 1 n=1 Tax=Clonostachys byssicola TaxID=160290 RepID=A0A9N9US45_9HYPO|nr:unnamed protein product [Clonostachys byssicola]
MAQDLTPAQVLFHNTRTDLYLTIRGKIYDASGFLEEHPGGEELLLDLAGRDATEAYDDAGHSEEADEILGDMLIGQLLTSADAAPMSQIGESTKATNIALKVKEAANNVTVKVKEVVVGAIKPSTRTSQPFLVPTAFRETELIEKTAISHNVSMYYSPVHDFSSHMLTSVRQSYRFKLPLPDVTLGLPIGQHVSIGAELPQTDGTLKEFVRSYTPLSDDEPGSFRLLIKSYPTGNISKHIGLLNLGDSIRIRGPKGAFQYRTNMVRHFGMVAGGTGITPMLQIIEAVHQGRQLGDKTQIDLVFANVAAEDILLKGRLDELAKMDDGFRVHYVLDKPPPGWSGGTGYVTGEMIAKWLPKPAKDVRILLCGPPPMVGSLKKITEALGFDRASPVSKSEDQVFAF